MNAYTDDKPFSLDLVGAATRQYMFIEKMVGLEWTKYGFFDDDENELVLRHAIARYHAFLDLMSSSPKTFFVPTSDIDLAWHTHQLLAIDYYNNCMDAVGRFIDQYGYPFLINAKLNTVASDDKIEESALSTAFDTTCRSWKNRFGIRYAYCGCPIPGDTIGQRMSRLALYYRDSQTSQRLLTPMENRRDSHAATHPSDHNAVYELRPGSNNDTPRARWSMKSTGTKEAYRKRLEKEKRMMALVRWEDRCDNYPAFLTPVPYTCQDWSTAIPYRTYGYDSSSFPTRAVASASTNTWTNRSYTNTYTAAGSGGYGDSGGAGCGGNSGGGDGGGDGGGGCGGGGCGGGGGD